MESKKSKILAQNLGSSKKSCTGGQKVWGKDAWPPDSPDLHPRSPRSPNFKKFSSARGMLDHLKAEYDLLVLNPRSRPLVMKGTKREREAPLEDPEPPLDLWGVD